MAGKTKVAFCFVFVPVVVAVIESLALSTMPLVKPVPVIVNSTEPPAAGRLFVAGDIEVTCLLVSVTVMVNGLEVIPPADAVTV